MKMVRVTGTSMWPVLKDGDLALIANHRSIGKGDLVVRSIDGQDILHRWLSEGVTKGDRYRIADPRLHEENLGRVVCVVPRRISERSGKLRGARVDGAVLRFLNRVQSAISRRQSESNSWLVQRTLLAALLLNGSLIRTAYYVSSSRRSANVLLDS